MLTHTHTRTNERCSCCPSALCAWLLRCKILLINFFGIGRQIGHQRFDTIFRYQRADNFVPFGRLQSDHLHFIVRCSAFCVQCVFDAWPNGQHGTGQNRIRSPSQSNLQDNPRFSIMSPDEIDAYIATHTSHSCPIETFRQLPRQYACEHMFTDESYCCVQCDSASSLWTFLYFFSISANDSGRNWRPVFGRYNWNIISFFVTVSDFFFEPVSILNASMAVCLPFRLWFDK